MRFSFVRSGLQRLGSHKAIAIAVTGTLGVALGLWLHQLGEGPPRAPTVAELLRGLQKRDTPFHTLWQAVWSSLPDLVTSWLPYFKPQPAIELRRAAARGLVAFGPQACLAIPGLVKALGDP